jgi:hypothetical protein
VRIISFSKKWPKLRQSSFTTFRFPRRDKDWYAGEVVQVYYKSRSPEREKLGIALIKSKEAKFLVGPGEIREVSDLQAREDGFSNFAEMLLWFSRMHGERIFREKLNKLTLAWQEFPK